MTETCSGARPRRAWALAGSTCLVVGAFSVSVVPGLRPQPGFDPVLDGWLQGGGYVLLALVALTSLTDPVHRRLRLALVAALVLRAAGFVLFLAVVRRSLPPAYPSIADGAWLASNVLFAAGVGYVGLRLSRRAGLTLVLDAVVGALVVAGVVVTLLFDTMTSLADPSLPRSAVVTNLAYPVLDVALLIVVVGLLVTSGGRATPPVWALAAGAVGLAAVDCVYLYEVVAGTFGPGSPLAALSLAATAVLAWSCRSLTSGPEAPRPDRVRGLATPAALATAGLLTLFLGAVRGAPVLGLALVTAGILVAIARAVFTREQDAGVTHELIEEKQLELERFKALVEASTDFVAIATFDGDLLYVNPRGRDMVGLDQDADVTTTRVSDYVEAHDWEHWRDVRRPAILESGRWQGEQHLLHLADGEPIPVASSSFLIRHPRTGRPWLLATVQRDITPRLAQQAQVQRLADERQELLAHLVEAQEDERGRIAADVHDDSVQALVVVELRLQMLRRQLVASGSTAVTELDLLHGSVRGATERLRHLLFDLESPARHADLATALREAAAYVLEDTATWTVDSSVEHEVPVAVRVTAYRIAKEALVNVRRHAAASHVTVRLATLDDGVEVTVSDDGGGFELQDQDPAPGHLGIRGMRDRASVAGGRVTVTSRPGEGTSVHVWLPGAATSPVP